MTGAGRSTAAKELEDLGCYVVDNLPPSLLRDVVRLVDESRGIDQPIAVVVDVRSGSFFDSPAAPTVAQRVTGRPHHAACSSRPPTRCWSAARRRPAGRTRCRAAAGCSTGCSASARCWPTLRSDADLVIDTSNLNVHQLTDRIAEAFGTAATRRGSR